MLDRIKILVKWLIGQGLADNQEGIGELLGYTNKSSFSQILNNKKPLPSDFIDRLCGLNSKVNKVWIEKGIEPMIIDSTIPTTTSDNYLLIPLINFDAVGGMHKPNDLSATDEEYIIDYIPFTDAKNNDVCIQVTSDSMIPTCPPGCVVLIREMPQWKDYFGYGNLFVIQLNDGRRIIKEVTKYDENPKDFVLCISHNKNVPAEELPKKIIVSVWKVIKVLTNRGW